MMGSAAETKIGAAYENKMLSIPLINAAIYMGHP